MLFLISAGSLLHCFRAPARCIFQEAFFAKPLLLYPVPPQPQKSNHAVKILLRILDSNACESQGYIKKLLSNLNAPGYMEPTQSLLKGDLAGSQAACPGSYTGGKGQVPAASPASQLQGRPWRSSSCLWGYSCASFAW